MGKPDWLKQVEENRKPITIGNTEYRPRDIGTRQCLMVRDYVDLTNSSEEFNELLCMHSPNGVFIDLGDAPKGHDLIINSEAGRVYVNGCTFTGIVGLQSLGDGSWGVDFQDHQPEYPKSLAGWLVKVYKVWLDEVYEKCAHLGLVEINRLHNRSIWHLIKDNLPKGKVKVQISA